MTDHAPDQEPMDGTPEHRQRRRRQKKASDHRPGLTATVVKVALFTGISVIITSIVLFSLLDIEVHPTAGYYADFTDVSGLQAGDTVRVAGVEVGKMGILTSTRPGRLRSTSMRSGRRSDACSKASDRELASATSRMASP